MEILCKGNGVHLITTIYCHCSFRFPPQHTLRARPLAVPSGALRAASLRSIASPAHRGVCSRIPHPRQISRDSHGQISTHVYILHIIPFLGCPPHSPPTTAAIPSRTIQPPIFFPFTIKTFYRSNFLFTIIPQPMSSPHFSHLAAPSFLSQYFPVHVSRSSKHSLRS